MKNVSINSLCILCIVLSPALLTAATKPGDTPSVMSRVEREEDPELGDLIRLAMENQPKISREEAFEVVRKVTQSYAQIKLLDQQIAEISRKADSATMGEMRAELLLARAELETKRITEVANLREMVGIIPKLPLAEQPLTALKAWVSLQPIGDRVYVLEGQPPFAEFWALQRWNLVGYLSEKDALDYARKRLSDKDKLPILFHLYHDTEKLVEAKELRNKIIAVAKEANAQMETEVRLESVRFRGSGYATFYLRQGNITTFYSHPMQRPDGGAEPLVTGHVNPKDLEQHILWRLFKPKNVPLTFRIEYDKASGSQAKQVADTARAVVKRLGISDLVPVEETLVEPVPESAFLGRWNGAARSDIQSLEIRTDGACQATMGDRFGKDTHEGAIKAGTSVSGTWLAATKEIYIDIKDKSPWGPNYIYKGYLQEDGNLIVDKGVIYPHGNFELGGGPRQMVLKKAQ